MIKRILVSLFLLILGISLGLPAKASQIPLLTWERGQNQDIVLGGPGAGKWTLILTNNVGRNLVFKRSIPNEAGYFVFSASIPGDFPLGGYVISTISKTGERNDVAAVQIVKKSRNELLRIPISLSIIIFGVQIPILLLILSRKKGIFNVVYDKPKFQATQSNVSDRILKSVDKLLIVETSSFASRVVFNNSIVQRYSTRIQVLSIVITLSLTMSMRLFPSYQFWLFLPLVFLCAIDNRSMYLFIFSYLAMYFGSTLDWNLAQAMGQISFCISIYFAILTFNILEQMQKNNLKKVNLTKSISIIGSSLVLYSFLVLSSSLDSSFYFLSEKAIWVTLGLAFALLFRDLLLSHAKDKIERINETLQFDKTLSFWLVVSFPIFMFAISLGWSRNYLVAAVFLVSFLFPLLFSQVKLKRKYLNVSEFIVGEAWMILLLTALYEFFIYKVLTLQPLDTINKSIFFILLTSVPLLIVSILVTFSDNSREVSV